MKKTIIVSNRLPLDVKVKKNELEIHPSVGGLATGLKSVHAEGNSLWIGWSGLKEEELTPALSAKAHEAIIRERCIPVLLTGAEVEDFYFGFSNKGLWPLFHYFMEYAEFELGQWKSYQAVNQKFADAVLEHLEDGDNVWVHDYQLLLVPQMIRDKKPGVTIGFFLHIPFPSYEILRTFPWREEVLQGMLGSDLIGFHTYDYERHFLSSVKRILNYEVKFNEITCQNRMVKVDSFPMGIDYDKFYQTAVQQEAQRHLEEQPLAVPDGTPALDEVQTIVSIDRMDYTKGIPNRIRAFEYFLNKYPQFKEKVQLIMLAVPSRSNVAQYQKLKRETDELVGRINGQFSTINWTPIGYFYRSMPFEELITLYATAPVALINPIRDGMNLVAKEYVATRVHQDGVLILSEMAGAAKELTEALLINPNNFEQIADTIKYALEMPIEEQRSRMGILQKRLQPNTVEKWAADFISALEETKNILPVFTSRKWDDSHQEAMFTNYKKAGKRLLLLDYDGTLVGFKNHPMDAVPDPALFALLDRISADGRTEIAIVSGRDKATIEQWFGDKNYSLITDHGVWLRRKGKEWKPLERLNTSWKDNIRPILETYVNRTPGSFVEEKNYSLAWHYRKSDPELAQMRVQELTAVLTSLISNNGLSVLEGNKVLEIKSSSVNKGRASSRLLAGAQYDYIFAMGDDWTDEYMFEELPPSAYTVKVGFQKTSAKYFVQDTIEVRALLERFAEA